MGQPGFLPLEHDQLHGHGGPCLLHRVRPCLLADLLVEGEQRGGKPVDRGGEEGGGARGQREGDRGSRGRSAGGSV